MIYVSNISKVVEGLNMKFKDLAIVIDKASKEIATSLEFANKSRVYTEGIDATGLSMIGKYSTKPILVGASSFKNKSSVNKVFGQRGVYSIKSHQKVKKGMGLKWVRTKTDPRHSLAVLPGGYKQIRDIDGDETSFVNLKRTGKMMKDLQIGKIGDCWCVGFPFAYSQHLTYNTMVAYFREKYGKKIWGVSQYDEIKIQSILKRYLDTAMQK